MRMAMRWVVCMVLALASARVYAQPLADRVPADAIVYVGWQGSAAMPPAYQQSHLKGVLDASNLPEFFNEFVPRSLARLGAMDPDPNPMAQAGREIMGILLRRPTAFFIAGIDFDAPDGMPRPKLGILCQAGPEADALLRQLQPLVQMAGMGIPFPMRAFRVDDIVAITVGYEPNVMPLAGGAVRPLLTHEKLQQAMAGMKVQPVVSAYIDIETCIALADRGVKQFTGPDEQAEWHKVKQAWGIADLKRAALAAGFDGRNWGTQFSVWPAPKTGIFAAAAQPISDDAIRLIPQSATWASITQFSAQDFLQGVRMVAQLEDGNTQKLDQGIADFNRKIGFDLDKDLLNQLGSEWVVYNDDTNGAGLIGMVIANRPRNPAAVERALNRLEELANEALAESIPGNVRIRMTRRQLAGTTIHTLGLPLVAPSWAVKDGALYIGLYPHSVVGAAERTKDAKSLLDNPDFLALRRQLGAQRASSLTFMNLPRTAAGAYQLLLPLSQLGLGAAELAGMEPPALVLPPLSRVRAHLAPAASFSWVDDAGFHYRGVNPFPGSQVLGMDSSVTVGATAVATSIILPALNAAKERANRVKCAVNLRQIGQGCFLYANDHKRYPPDLGALVREVDLSPEVFICPSHGGEVPMSVRTGNLNARVKWVNENAAYVYLGAKMNPNMPADRVLAYEKPDNHAREGINILFNDGHIEWLHLDAAMELIREQQGRP